MPKASCRLLKMSLLLGLFVFIVHCGFTFYYLILRFSHDNSHVISWYEIGTSKALQILIIKHSILINAATKVEHIASCWIYFFKFRIKHSKYDLQFFSFLTKQSQQYLKVRSYYLNILKSLQKQSQALKIYTTRLLVSIFHLPFGVLININPAI